MENKTTENTQNTQHKECILCNARISSIKSRARFCSDCRMKQKKENLLNLSQQNQIYTFSSSIDKTLLEIYSKPGKRKGDIAKLAKIIKFPRYILYKRAKQIGVVAKITNKWSKEEISFLNSHHNFSLNTIYALFVASFPFRTKNAIANRLKIIRSKIRAETYTAENLSLCFGVNSDTVENWIKKGFLRAQKIGNLYSILNTEIKEFIQYHPNRFKLANVDQIWFLDLIFDGKISDYKTRGI